jgi:AraC-like DNA-binding protein
MRYHPLDYVQEFRVEATRKKLAPGGSQLAIEVSYKDLTSLRRMFKHKAGLTPALHSKKNRRPRCGQELLAT